PADETALFFDRPPRLRGLMAAQRVVGRVLVAARPAVADRLAGSWFGARVVVMPVASPSAADGHRLARATRYLSASHGLEYARNALTAAVDWASLLGGTVVGTAFGLLDEAGAAAARAEPPRAADAALMAQAAAG